MESPPTDPRVTAMLAALLGSEWTNLEGEIAFEKAAIEAWVFAAETMLRAADAVDPIRVAIRGVALDGQNSEDTAGPSMPTRSG